MDDYLILLLLLLALVVVAYFLTCFNLALNVQKERNAEIKDLTLHKRLTYLHDKSEIIKSAIMQLNVIISVAIGYIVLLFTMQYFSEAPIHCWSIPYLISLFITTLISVIFINLIPSVSFSKHVDSLTGRSYYLVLSVMWIMYPTASLVVWLRNILFKSQLDSEYKAISMEELSDAVEIVSSANTEEDKRILSGMLRFAKADVEDIMCHRTDIVSIDLSAKLEEVKDLFKESELSRIPVYNGNSDNIEGIIFLKEFFSNIENPNFNWHTIIHEPLFVNSDYAINKLLLIFQSKKEHMAIVVDQFGSTLGLVTLEDVLEEIVGEINDEFDDEEEENYTLLKDGTYVIDGKTELLDFIENVELEKDIMDDMPEDVDTIAGLVIELLQDFPKVGATVEFNNTHKLTVISMDRHRIDKIKIEKIDDEHKAE